MQAPDAGLVTPTHIEVPVRPDGSEDTGRARFPDAVGADAKVIPAALLKAALVAADLTVVTGAMIAAFFVTSTLGGANPRPHLWVHLLLGLVALPLWIVIFFRYQLYTANRIAEARDEMERLVHATIVAAGLMAVIAFVTHWTIARGWLVTTFALALLALVLERIGARSVFRSLRRRGHMLRRVVIVGINSDGTQLAASLHDGSLGYRVLGFIGEHMSPVRIETGPAEAVEVPVLGPYSDASKAVTSGHATGAILVSTALRGDIVNRLLRELAELNVHVEVIPALRDVAPSRLNTRVLGRFPILQLDSVAHRGWRAVAKRVFDVTLAGCALVCAAPAIVVLAAAVKLETQGPAFFMQERVGYRGRTFRMVKLRTMVADAEDRVADLRIKNEADGALFKITDDPRTTRVGRTLRRWSLDELPQFWNVVRGQMSLVGPRPALPSEVSEWSPEHHHRLRVKPGITGMWQVNGRSDVSFDEYTRLDLYYVDNWSLLTDMSIVAKTVPVVLSRRGAS
jgi:exopolysaccharide biosynthesis polyprenyl glycosylphosphotransferase